MSKKIIVVGGGGVGRTTLAEQIAKHDFIHDVTICELAGAMLSTYSGKWKEKGSDKTPKKKKRKKKRRR